MIAIAVVSMKGGVGKTSATANIAASLARVLGEGQVGVIDLDPQNSLHLHFGQSAQTPGGLAVSSVSGSGWERDVYRSEYGVDCVPYGEVSEPDREAFEQLLETQPGYVGQQLQAAGFAHKRVVLIDTPPGPSVYLRQASQCADVALVVLLADGGSYATIPAMEAWLGEMSDPRPGLKSLYLFNQVDGMNTLGQDVIEVVRLHLAGRVLRSVIHADEAVAEALAFQKPVASYAPHSQASHDMEQVARQLMQYVVQ